MGRTVSDLLASISARELAEWQAFEVDHGPIGLRPDWTGALIVATLANIHRDSKTHPQPYEMEDFLVGGAQTFEQTPEQMAMVAEMTAVASSAFEQRQQQIAERS